ncbi:hypothetical protein JYU34_006418 [Plutella xylostella]|uniref:Uncharacterized protein n=1 Tax=Plutella xylostella TaxID=51655 RepID=A0ABQ7QRY7_PLUXY|nr:hypothetical protein JYU34_006418 [Plutella xylostella]
MRAIARQGSARLTRRRARRRAPRRSMPRDRCVPCALPRRHAARAPSARPAAPAPSHAASLSVHRAPLRPDLTSRELLIERYVLRKQAHSLMKVK